MSRPWVLVLAAVVGLLLIVRCGLVTNEHPREPGCIDAVTVDCRE